MSNRIRLDIVPAPMPVYTDAAGDVWRQLTRSNLPHHLRLVGGNGEVLMHSENYANLSNARRAAKRLAADLHITTVREHDVTVCIEVED